MIRKRLGFGFISVGVEQSEDKGTKTLFVGGEYHGEMREVLDYESNCILPSKVAEGRRIMYIRQIFVYEGKPICIFTFGKVEDWQVIKLLKEAKL